MSKPINSKQNPRPNMQTHDLAKQKDRNQIARKATDFLKHQKKCVRQTKTAPASTDGRKGVFKAGVGGQTVKNTHPPESDTHDLG